MDHVAIMKRSWGLTQKILNGEKTVETRWYMHKVVPWNKIHPGEIVYFKDTGCPVTLKATVSKVEQFENLNDQKIKQVLNKFSASDLGTTEIPNQIQAYVKNKKYCIAVHLMNPQKINIPFNISKKGFGAMSAWITTDDIRKIII